MEWNGYEQGCAREEDRQSMCTYSKQWLIWHIPITINPLSFPAWATARCSFTLTAGVFKVLERSCQRVRVYRFRPRSRALPGGPELVLCRLGPNPMAWRGVGGRRGNGFPVHTGGKSICFGSTGSGCAGATCSMCGFRHSSPGVP